jgi:Tfp pilus assembly protein PilF
MRRTDQHDSAGNGYRLLFARAAWAQAMHDRDLPNGEREKLLKEADERAAEAIRLFLDQSGPQLAQRLREFGRSQLLVSVFLIEEPPSTQQTRRTQGLSALRQAVEMRTDDMALRRLFLDCLLIYPSPATRDSALEQIRILLEADPKEHAMYARRAALYMVTAQPDGERTRLIEADLDHAITLSRGQEEAYWLQLISFYESEKRTDEITPVIRKALESIPVSVDLRIAHGMHLLRQKRIDEATAQLTRLAQDKPRNPAALLALVWLHMIQAQAKNAMALAQRAGKLAPDDETPATYIAQCHMMQRHPAQAADAYRRAREIALRRFYDLPRNILHAREALALRAKIETLAIDQAQMWLDAVANARRDKDRKKFLGRAKAVVKATPETHRLHPLWLTVQARIALAEGNRGEAQALLERAHDSMGAQPDKQTIILLAKVYIAGKQLGDARRILERATADNRDPLMLTALAGVLIKSNEQQQAAKLLDEVLEAHPKFDLARRLKAQLEKGKDEPLPPF